MSSPPLSANCSPGLRTDPQARCANAEQILLVTATAQEMAAAIRALPGAEAVDLSFARKGALLAGQKPPPPVLFLPHAGSKAKKAPAQAGTWLRLVVCGVGPLAAALATGTELALSQQAGSARAPVRGIVHAGLAGTYNQELAPVGSLVLADSECFPEYGVWPEYDESLCEKPGAPLPLAFAQGILPDGQAVSGQIALEPERELGNMGLTCHSGVHGSGHCDGHCDGHGGGHGGGYCGEQNARHDVWRKGAIATVSAVSGTTRRAGRMARESGALVEAMEGFAVALCARAWNLPFAEIRAVSNVAGYRPPDTWNFEAAADALTNGIAALCGLNV